MNLPNIFYIILGVVLIIILIILSDYNALIRLRNRVKRAASTIDICLNKRFELIPNLVEVVKGYSKYEKSTLKEITELRGKYQSGMDINKASDLNNDLNRLLAIVEKYPELKANTQYLDLQQKLSKIEDEIGLARIVYNREVTRYNTKTETVPSNIVASMFNFKKVNLFTIEEKQKENTKIKL